MENDNIDQKKRLEFIEKEREILNF